MITYIGNVIPISRGTFLDFGFISWLFEISLLLENLDHENLNKRKIARVIRRFKTINRIQPSRKVVTMILDSIARFGVAR
jgi:hypothetical protein